MAGAAAMTRTGPPCPVERWRRVARHPRVVAALIRARIAQLRQDAAFERILANIRLRGTAPKS